ncbi:MAG: GNAT family N-acetyltransferase [Candidatus Onthomonas sp.]
MTNGIEKSRFCSSGPGWERSGYLLRPAVTEDAEPYYDENFCPLDPELARLTGCLERFDRSQVIAFFRDCVQAADRFDFLLVSPEGRIVGESVLNEIDWLQGCANFRIALFHPEERNRGLGSWMVETTRDFAFGTLELHRLELDVFSTNPRAERVYRKAGFRREGVRREAIQTADGWADDILMALLASEWSELVKKL